MAVRTDQIAEEFQRFKAQEHDYRPMTAEEWRELYGPEAD
jgi:hypothetical protein